VGCAVVEVGAEGDVADVGTGTGAGAGRKVAPSAARVPATSTRPAPTPCIAWALEVIAWVTAAADEVGENDIARAARPDTTGVLAEVPHTSAYPALRVVVRSQPGAATGTHPPKFDHEYNWSSGCVAATPRTPGSAAG
jgi:hypothetical protein